MFTQYFYRYLILSITCLTLTACPEGSDTPSVATAPSLTITADNYNLNQGAQTTALISMINSTNITDPVLVTVTSQDATLMTVSPANCVLTTHNNTCTITLTASSTSLGSTTIVASAPNFTSVSSALFTINEYEAFNYSNATTGGSTLLTGVRAVTGSSSQVYISGAYKAPNVSTKIGLLYEGPLAGNGSSGTWTELTPPGADSTTFYGPNSSPSGTIQVVGSYATAAAPSTAIGILYQANADFSNPSWTILAPPVEPGDTLLNTIAHSNMGNIAVGNFDTELDSGKAFIYDFNTTPAYHELIKPNALSITAYGIWWNGGSSYTIAGGFSDTSHVDVGYLVDWDSLSNTASNWHEYYYKNQPLTSIGAHFEGITSDGNGGYNAPSDWASVDHLSAGAAFVHIDTQYNATWTDIVYPGADITSANTSYLNSIIGVYQNPNDSVTYGYVATTNGS
jgi:hypothetical protein